MEIAPIGSAQLASLLAGSVPQQLSGVTVAQAGSGVAARTEERTSVSKAGKGEGRGPDAAAAKEKAGTGTTLSAAFDKGMPGSSERVEPAVERALFEYLIDAEKVAGPMTDLHGIMGSAFQSIGASVEDFQRVMATSGQVPIDGLGAGQEAAADAAEPDAVAQAGSGKTGEPAGINDTSIDRLLQQYTSVTWAAFKVSLAVNSVGAATSSVNSLVKQQ
ncbi:hypothetical protein [Nitratireductor pacificus]|uniref:Uncharacterized protein n=1 Tax=Nitratireductor pacificus pht-3B TaxID=391937 RepID=K2N0G5_9HYPH|nr:hypothetical protein [Nitratireductor pacificus]EKF17693.1 hypothetical protein NA2_16577 [Nitratireductor pacificus pht-3B]